MFNQELGSPQQVDGRSCLSTAVGLRGHALYGPYESLEPGDYFVSFTLARVDAGFLKPKTLLAVFDVSCDAGNQLIERREIRASELDTELRTFGIRFTIPQSCRAEYRLWTSGKAALIIEDNRRAIPINPGVEGLEDEAAFPEHAGSIVPFFVENRVALVDLYHQGVQVRIRDGAVLLTANGITLHARCVDDLNFIGELFFENAYNIQADRDLCLIDIGMNIGLASLQFALKSEVKEIHAFEPFPETLQRSCANLRLNPQLAEKITPYGMGLSDHDFDGPVSVDTHGNSGAMTTVGVRGGIEVNLKIRDAASMLSPIIENAEARGLEIVLKVDCEGSEFAIFESLEKASLFGRIRAFMVEWHTLFEGSSQETLAAPLRRAGFMIFDRSPPIGNGFFYAVRMD